MNIKIRCLKDSDEICYTRKGPVKTPDNMKVKAGDIYTAIKEVVGYRGELKWVLQERPSNARYAKDQFEII